MKTVAWSAARAAVMSATLAWSHPVPAIPVECRFVDAEGHPLPASAAGLSVRLLPTGGAPAVSGLASGAATLPLAAGHPLPDSVTLEVRDPWFRPVPILGAEAREGRIRVAFPVAAHAGEPVIFAAGNGSAARYVLEAQGLRPPAGAAVRPFRLAWPPADLSAAQAREWEAGEAVDRKNAEDLRRRMAALREKGWTP